MRHAIHQGISCLFCLKLLSLKGEYEMMNDLKQKVLAFREARGWAKFHNPKDLAISINLEAAELLENFQWSSPEEAVAKKSEQIVDELADVFIYGILMADAMGINLEEAIRNKLTKNELKYPVEKSYGKKDKYTEL